MSPTHDRLLGQLSRLKETPLPDGFEAALHERLVRASQQTGAVVVPFRPRPRRKVTLVLIAALSVPLAAAAASGVLSHYWSPQPTTKPQAGAEQGKAKAAATRKTRGRSNAAPAAPLTPPESAERTSGSVAPVGAPLAHPAPDRPKRASSRLMDPSGEDAVAADDSARANGSIAPGEPKGGTQPGSEAQPASADVQPASAPLEQLDLSWPGGNTAQRTPTKGTSSPSSSAVTTPSAPSPATSGLRRAGQNQSAGEHSGVQNREGRGRTEAGRSGAGSERAQRGGAAQQRQMNQRKRGQ
ncbi:MAG: hypothetical protein JW940_37625 [Polyangiaceae bacterium]|nr:hypothetical protein [Polyangiaceae bacterium]